MNAVARNPLFAVRGIKHDGIRGVEIKRYTDRAEAEADVASLRRIGIESEIAEIGSSANAGQDAPA